MDSNLGNNNLFQGKLVRLIAHDPEVMAEKYSRWHRDSEYTRLLDSGISFTHSKKAAKEWIEKYLAKEDPSIFAWIIQTLEGDQIIGDIGLEVMWNHREAFVGLGIGERENWGKGYGTDAMRIILRYAFEELDLARVSLDVFEYNPRGIHSYEKAGFTYEGRMRGFLNRDGRRWDMIFMGILREEWIKRQQEKRQ